MKVLELLGSFKDDVPAIAVLVTIILAFIGYIVSYVDARVLARKKDRLELVNQRLNRFYGPLYVATAAGQISYKALIAKLGKKQHVFEGDSEPSEEELREWFLWMKTVFTPLNDLREKIIIENAHLIVEEKMPECLLDFVTLVVGYKAVLAKWEKGDFAEKYSLIDFPTDLHDYINQSYKSLKDHQTHLLETL